MDGGQEAVRSAPRERAGEGRVDAGEVEPPHQGGHARLHQPVPGRAQQHSDGGGADRETLEELLWWSHPNPRLRGGAEPSNGAGDVGSLRTRPVRAPAQEPRRCGDPQPDEAGGQGGERGSSYARGRVKDERDPEQDPRGVAPLDGEGARGCERREESSGARHRDGPSRAEEGTGVLPR